MLFFLFFLLQNLGRIKKYAGDDRVVKHQDHGLTIEAGKEEVFDFDPENPGCKLTCELPSGYGFPCKHWMYPAFLKSCQLPFSLFHPRWLFDEPAALHE